MANRRTLPLTKVSFFLSGAAADVAAIETRMGIFPCKIRSSFPPGSIADPYWSIEAVSGGKNFEAPIREIMDRLAGKEDEIRAICAQYGIAPALVIVAHFSYVSRPEMYFCSDILRYFADLGAEICIDPCI